MSAASGIIGGVLGLALLEVVVSDQGTAGRVGGLFTTVSSVLSRWLDPSVALIPDLSGSTSSSTQAEAIAYQAPAVGGYQSTPRATAANPQPAIST